MRCIDVDQAPDMSEAILTTWEQEIGAHLDVYRGRLMKGWNTTIIVEDLLDVIRHAFEHGYVLDVHIRREGEQ